WVDTDANGYEGYVIDVSRTFLCGDDPTPGQKEAYRVAFDCVTGMLELVRPGVTFAEFADRAPRLPAAYRARRYPGMVHQAGLEAAPHGRPGWYNRTPPRLTARRADGRAAAPGQLGAPRRKGDPPWPRSSSRTRRSWTPTGMSWTGAPPCSSRATPSGRCRPG